MSSLTTLQLQSQPPLPNSRPVVDPFAPGYASRVHLPSTPTEKGLEEKELADTKEAKSKDTAAAGDQDFEDDFIDDEEDEFWGDDEYRPAVSKSKKLKKVKALPGSKSQESASMDSKDCVEVLVTKEQLRSGSSLSCPGHPIYIPGSAIMNHDPLPASSSLVLTQHP